MLQSMRSQRVGHDWATKLSHTEGNSSRVQITRASAGQDTENGVKLPKAAGICFMEYWRRGSDTKMSFRLSHTLRWCEGHNLEHLIYLCLLWRPLSIFNLSQPSILSLGALNHQPFHLAIHITVFELLKAFSTFVSFGVYLNLISLCNGTMKRNGNNWAPGRIWENIGNMGSGVPCSLYQVYAISKFSFCFLLQNFDYLLMHKTLLTSRSFVLYQVLAT